MLRSKLEWFVQVNDVKRPSGPTRKVVVARMGLPFVGRLQYLGDLAEV